MTTYLSEKIKIVSFFSILLVVFLHAYNLENKETAMPLFFGSATWFTEDFISYGLTRIAVPLFFLFSGFLFFLNMQNGSGFSEKIKKRFRTLFVPFLFWSLFGIAFYFTLQSIPPLQPFFSKGLVRDFSLKQWALTVFVTPIPYQFWFIRDLMLLVLVSPILYFAAKNFGKMAIVIAFLIWLCDFGIFKNSAEALLFFFLGSYAALQKQEAAEIRIGQKSYVFLLVWLFLLALKTTLAYFYFPELYCRLVFKLSILFGIPAFWGVCDLWLSNRENLKRKLLQAAGFTFFIYAFHEPVLTIFKKMLFIIFKPTEAGSLGVFWTAPVLTILLSFAVGAFLRKFCRGFYTIITGGR